MPNTLAHLGVGGLATRAFDPTADPKWIYIGCIIPDAPWILRRCIEAARFPVDEASLVLYSIAQSSLAACLLLSAALAIISTSPRRVFLILAFNSLLHLLLDACQTKWGNGVHLLAPFAWNTWNFALFWPESAVTVILTLWGLLYALALWRRNDGTGIGLSWRRPSHAVAAGLFLAAYLIAPWVLRPNPDAVNNHFVKSLWASGNRTGRHVELDRAEFEIEPRGDTIHCLGNTFKAIGAVPNRSGTVSIRGTFDASNVVYVEAVHRHWRVARDLASLVGLAVVAAVWLIPPRRR